jgi:diadenosine tetraphosphate (Ap4A) HIT family hydrolase
MTHDTPATCPLCLPRPDDSESWIKVRKLAVSTLYLDRNQTYRGHCQLIYDDGHATGIEALSHPKYIQLMNDVYRAAGAIQRTCHPDHMNYASLGNVVPHVHWHLVPRYRSDPRWGAPIYTTDSGDMPVTRLTAAEYQQLVDELHRQLERRA